jgi:hypothetical protein
MSKVLSETKSVALNFALLFYICLSFLPLRVVAQPIDFSNKTIEEPIDIEFWKQHIQKGIEIDSSDRHYPRVIFHRPINFAGAAFDSSVSFYLATFDSSVIFYNVEFHSTADFGGTNFKDTADFHWATFDASVRFWGADFHSTADFEGTNFKGGANFFRATFETGVRFSAAGFHSTVDFLRTDFKGTADFQWTNFKRTTNFDGAAFDSSVSFSLAEFDSTTDFGHTKFNSPAYFEQTKFKAMADFGWAAFDSSVSFSYGVFDSTANFVVTKFKGRADFEWTRFREDVIFSDALLPDTLDFRDIKDIRKEIDFTLSLLPRSKGKCHIALAGADISKIKLNMTLFTLCFPIDTNFGESSTGKDSVTSIDSTSYDGQLSVYESVLKKLKDDGFMESYQILDIEYRRLKYEHGGFFDWYIMDTLQRRWWNYGYSKERVFLWTFGLWVLFSLVNLKVYPKLSERVYEIKFLEKMQDSAYTGIKKWIFYALQVVSYTAIVFFGLKMDVAKFKKGVVREHPWLFVYLMVVYVVGLVCLGFIVNIIFTR